MIYKFNNGGTVKLQNAGSVPQSENKIMKLWHKAYNSKLGETVRNFMFGKDYNLSNEEYIQKHGFGKPNELAMPWFTQVSGLGSIMNLNKLGKVNITLEPEKYWYVAHQTASKNLPSIMKDGLKTGSGLSGTAIPLSEDFLKSFTEGTLKQQHLLHKGSDALVVAKFPKSKFPSGDLDDISIRLMDLGESNNFEVPAQYLKGFIKDQFKQGGIIKAQRGTGLAGLPSIKIPENFKNKVSDWFNYKKVTVQAGQPYVYIGLDGLPTGTMSDNTRTIRIPRQRIKAFQRMRPPVLGQHATIGKNGGQIT